MHIKYIAKMNINILTAATTEIAANICLKLPCDVAQMTLDILAAAATGIFWKGVKLTMKQI